MHSSFCWFCHVQAQFYLSTVTLLKKEYCNITEKENKIIFFVPITVVEEG